jgi:nickel superoxide dismutase
MSALYSLFRILDGWKAAQIAYAHCDIPCGIYDPHTAQLAAHTVVRMVMLIGQLPKLGPEMTSEQRLETLHKLNRYIAVKEEHAELCKKEIRILWGDYFKPEHTEKFPELNELVFNTLKLASNARQEVSMQASKELLAAVNKIAEIFWKTKNVETVQKKSPYPTELESVYPKV